MNDVGDMLVTDRHTIRRARYEICLAEETAPILERGCNQYFPSP